MKKQLSLLFAGTVLSAMVLSGCNTNNDVNDDRIAPQRINNPVNTPDNRNINNNVDRNRINNNLNRDRINNNDFNGRDNNLNNNYYRPSQDKNTDTDKDMIKDNNTKPEELIEDDIDTRDKDRKDE